MSSYHQYQDARDASWRALLQLPEKKLPVDVDALAGLIGAEILPFPDKSETRLRALVLRAANGPCVSLRIRRVWNIFVRGGMTPDQRRFAIARELGRLLLTHQTQVLAPGVHCFVCRASGGDMLDDPQEMDDSMADVFALRLLAPACLLHELHIDTAGKIAAVCGLPPAAASARAERMELLNARDAYYTHTLETRVRDAFLPWLRAQRGMPEPAARIRYASEAVRHDEIHGYLPKSLPVDDADIVPWEEPAPAPTPIQSRPAPAVIQPLRLTKAEKKESFRLWLSRRKPKLLFLLACLLAAVVFYFLGR